MFPLRPHITKSRAKVMILIIWVLSTVLAVPMGLAYKIRVVSDGEVPDYTLCDQLTLGGGSRGGEKTMSE